MYKIVLSPAEILRTKVGPAPTDQIQLKKVLGEMRSTLVAQRDPEGVGLAANQVGLPYRIFLARFDTRRNSPIEAFIDAQITTHSKESQPSSDTSRRAPLEGCLSLPRYYGSVSRWLWIEVRSQRYDFKTGSFFAKTERFTGFPAVVLQHEIDHLEGKIFVERILEQHGRLYRITGRDSEGKDDWEEVDI